jgi:Ca2+-binding EF-hand superfamily protein
MHNALITLYEASIYLHPPNSGPFDEEDRLIRNAKGDVKASSRVRATNYLARMGIDGYKVASLFGNFVSDDPHSHWLRPASSYATIERALANPISAAALAKRIWQSLVVTGAKSMTAEDIAEVLGPFRKQEAGVIFQIIDENESGDIRLDEMISTLIEAGRIRSNIYKTMDNIDHCINTFDWVCLVLLAVVMVFFISKCSWLCAARVPYTIQSVLRKQRRLIFGNVCF